MRLLKQLAGVVRYVKIGSVLFTSVGPAIITRMRALGFDVFLDLKFHDIPSTVERSCRAAVHHGVWMLTVHASGEPAMLEAAAIGVRREAARIGVPRPRVVGVTVLTSVAADATTARRVMALATRAQHAGLDGVVASAQDAAMIRRRFGSRFLIVCPGIRSARDTCTDQQRIASPSEALAHGATFLVVGRPITDAPDPRRRVGQLLNEMEDGCAC